ncbi:hypothetical protein GCM10011581_45930 [Saccharopolyspora subtropica]|uniref:Uncharacterized protein n=1 Tax=Saccharopolyspora thermophila TaxID=89367 RepID=A0A917K968_9PSEU|nr:hypothetical protein GCM10011581_45930 [Saccharopolyspora subtropica]
MSSPVSAGIGAGPRVHITKKETMRVKTLGILIAGALLATLFVEARTRYESTDRVSTDLMADLNDSIQQLWWGVIR